MRRLMVVRLGLVLIILTSLFVPLLLLLLPRERSLKFTNLLILRKWPSTTPCVAKEPWMINSYETELSNSTRWNRDSCISRSQQALYRKPSQIFKFPPKLSQALAEYERMHSRCYHAKDLVHFESDGLGNRLVGLISTFIYALLTNRVFLVDPRGQSAKLLCQPFPNSSWILPEDFPFHHLDQAPALGDSGDLNQLKIVHLWFNSVRRDQIFLNRHTRSELEPVTWIVMSSNLYFIPRLFTLPEYWNTLVNLFPDPALAVTHVSRYLLLPQDHIWNRIIRFQTTYLATPGATKLGLQIRLHHREDPGAFHQASYERILQCLVENGLLPGVRVDQEPALTSLRNPSGDGSRVQFHTLSHDGQQTETLRQAENALSEMWLLSLCDQLVTSSSSTFGYVAQGLAGLKPYVLNVKPEDLTRCDLPPCSLRLSAAPCNHQPYFTSEEERERSPALRKWMNAHLRRCQDNFHGIQLVS